MAIFVSQHLLSLAAGWNMPGSLQVDSSLWNFDCSTKASANRHLLRAVEISLFRMQKLDWKYSSHDGLRSSRGAADILLSTTASY